VYKVYDSLAGSNGKFYKYKKLNYCQFHAFFAFNAKRGSIFGTSICSRVLYMKTLKKDFDCIPHGRLTIKSTEIKLILTRMRSLKLEHIWQSDFYLLGHNAVTCLKSSDVSEEHVASIFRVEE
jgi:hypothetical protein